MYSILSLTVSTKTLDMNSLISQCEKFLKQKDSTSSAPKQEDASQASSAKSKEASPSKGSTKKESQEIRNSSNILEELESIKSFLVILQTSVAEIQTSVSELSRLIKSRHPAPTATGAQGSYAQPHAPQTSCAQQYAPQASQPQPPSPTPSATPKRSEESSATTNQRNKGWFPAPEQDSNEKYFKKLLSSQSGDARFEASVVNDEAFFQPSPNISLDALLSSDVLERVIQYKGVSKEKASHMEVVGEGIAIREEDNTWTVKENVLIRLS